MSMVVIMDRAALMQRLMDAVIQGYSSFISGTVKTERVHALCEKFSKRYLVALNRNQLAYRRAKGQGNARLIFADLGDPKGLHWWLLVTDGPHPARERNAHENFSEAFGKGSRLCVEGYELFKSPRSNNEGGGFHFSWSMAHETKRQWRYQIRIAVRARGADDAVARVVRLLHMAPGFDSIKAEVDKLTDFLRAEWRRTGHDAEPPAIPAALKPVRRLASDGVPLVEWIAARIPQQAT